jgi:hypothetical protein
MKIVFLLTLMLMMIVMTVIGCLIIFDVFTLDQGLAFGYKALAALLLLGVSSAIFSLLIGTKSRSGE